MVRRIDRSDDEWREMLSPEEFRVLRRAGTEPAFSGALTDVMEPGLYECAGCGTTLFSSETKFALRLWLAELLGAGRRQGDHRARRRHARHAPGRGSLRSVWRASRPRLWRRTRAHRAAVLHQLRVARVPSEPPDGAAAVASRSLSGSRAFGTQVALLLVVRYSTERDSCRFSLTCAGCCCHWLSCSRSSRSRFPRAAWWAAT